MFESFNVPARWVCGVWPPELAWGTIIFDFIIFLSYSLIPLSLICFFIKQHKLSLFREIRGFFVLFGAFIFSCGLTHLIEIFIFWDSLYYKIQFFAKGFTAFISAWTAIYLISKFKFFFSLKTERDFNIEHDKREIAETVANESLFEKAFSNSRIGIALLSDKGEWLRVNEATCRITGRTQEELLLTDFQSITHPEDLEKDLGLMEKVLNGEIEGYEIPKRYFKKDGSVIWIILTVSCVRFDNKKVRYFISQIQDVTDSTLIQERLESVLRSGKIGIWDFLVNQNKIKLDNTCKSIFEQDISKIEDFYKILFPQDLKSVENAIQKSILRGSPYYAKYRILCKNKVKTIEAFGSPIKDRDENVYKMVGVIVDITDITITLNKLQKINEELQHFSYVMSHDLKEPLRAISGYASIITEESSKNNFSEVVSYTNLISRRVKRLYDLITDISNYTKIEKQLKIYTKFNCLEKINFIIDDFSGKECKFIVNERKLNYSIYFNEFYFQTIFQNIISNSVKYGGNIIEIDLEKHRKHYVFSVRDNGIGIRKEYLDKVFTPFFRLHNKDEYEGSGLGLSLCKKIMEDCGGSMEVKSEYKKWSEFKVNIPRK